MLDEDLAELYSIETKRLNEQIKRNSDRFPRDFMFELTKEEFNSLRSQFVTLKGKGLRSQFATSNLEPGGRRYLPYAFTEQGISMLSGVLRSKKAIEINIQIIRAFISMRKFIAKNSQIFQRLDNIERKQIIHDAKFEEVFNALDNQEPQQGIFFEGQIFDAYSFISNIIRKANNSIILIDNYIDERTLNILTKRKKNIKVDIYTKFSKELKLDLEKHNAQYSNIEIKDSQEYHDRFLIIDNELYHLGASLKDLGNKCFAFSKLNKKSLGKLKKLI